jgi:hypothetical protein
MADKWVAEFVGLGTAIVGLALVAVVLSKKADTGGVLGAAGTALSSTIKAAVSPITG